MIELKFKVFDQRHSIEYWYWLLSVERIDLDKKLASCYIEKWDYIPLYFDWEYKEAELLHYIWLNDINNIEIYSEYILMDKNNKIFKVEYNNDSSSYILRWLNNNIWSMDITCDVIIDEKLSIIWHWFDWKEYS